MSADPSPYERGWNAAANRSLEMNPFIPYSAAWAEYEEGYEDQKSGLINAQKMGS